MAVIHEGPRAAMRPAQAPEALYDKLSPGPGMRASEVADHQSARIHGAMIKATAERGYDAVRVRDVASLAGVSTRAFYELFDGKEGCFLRTHELLARRVARGILVSQAGERDWRERLGLVFGAFARALAHESEAVRFLVVDAYAAGPRVLEHARRAQSTFEAMISEVFARAPHGIRVPPLLIEGMVAGIGSLIRTHFLTSTERELPELARELEKWILCYPHRAAGDLTELDNRTTSVQPTSGPSSTSSSSADDDRVTILAATAKLVEAHGYRNLTVSRIRAGAGVSRQRLCTQFDGVDDCFVAAVDQRVGEMLEQVSRANASGRTWAGGVYRAIAALSDWAAGDRVLAELFLPNNFPPGSNASRCRKRIIAAISDQIANGIPPDLRPDELTASLSSGAIWELFDRYVVKSSPGQRPQIAATLSYIVLAPMLGPSATVATICRERTA